MADRHSDIASVLRQRLFQDFHLGQVREGERLPSVRDLARELGADPRVVLAAYRALEKEGLVELRARSGIYFGSGARAPTQGAADEHWVVSLARQGLARGIPLPGLADHLRRRLSGAELRTACIECNDDQIAALVRELRADFGLATTGVRDAAVAPGAPVPRAVLDADLLVTTQFHAGRVQEIAQRVGKPWVAASLRTDLLAAIARRLADHAVYMLVVDPVYADKLRQIFAATAGAARFHPRLVTGITHADVPDDAAVYASEAARASIADPALRARVAPPMRELAHESATDLLTFIVRANAATSRPRP